MAASHVRRSANDHGAEVVRVGGSFAGVRGASVAASPSAHLVPERVVASKFHVRRVFSLAPRQYNAGPQVDRKSKRRRASQPPPPTHMNGV